MEIHYVLETRIVRMSRVATGKPLSVLVQSQKKTTLHAIRTRWCARMACAHSPFATNIWALLSHANVPLMLMVCPYKYRRLSFVSILRKQLFSNFEKKTESENETIPFFSQKRDDQIETDDIRSVRLTV